MEESAHGRCSVVYYRPGSTHDIAELYTAPDLPAAVTSQSQPLSDHVYNNVRRLLDVDQGNFAQVFLGSNLDQCSSRLAEFARSTPTALLFELNDATPREEQASVFNFLQEIRRKRPGSHYQQHVMPFVLLATVSGPGVDLLAESGLDMSDLDTMRSPLCSEAINQLVGRVKEITRPSARLVGADMAHGLVNSIASSSKPQLANHRPDEILSAQRKAAVEEAITKWQFHAHEFDMDELTYGALVMLEHVLRNPELEAYQLSRAELVTFLLAARRQYRHEREVHYHNWRHAVDVTQSVYCFLCDVRLCPPSGSGQEKIKEVNALERLLSPFDALNLLVSAIGHDVGHPGVNNAFLVACNHQLACMYNDKSVLENYHCAAYSQLLRRHWPSLSDIPRFRSTMISTILATDMQRHFEYMGNLDELKQKVEKSERDLGDWSDKDRDRARELVMALLIKAADISNVARPFDISAQWAKILMNEFSRQGELEHELQIPTCLFGGPPNKEDLLAAAQSQKGFMNLFGFPLFRGISDVMPNVSCTIPELENNKDVWEQKITDEKARREALGDGGKSLGTYGSVTETQVEEARTRKRESEPAMVPAAVPQTPTSSTKRIPEIGLGGNSPPKHPASEQRHHFQLGPSLPGDDKRSSTPTLWPSVLQASPSTGGTSRRSSKDVALQHHLHELSAHAQQNIAPGSRRGSADAGWQLHPNYPGSRRGSKEESLTTILVTSQGSPASKSVSGSPKTSKAALSGKRQSISKSSNAAKQSVASSASQSVGSTADIAPVLVPGEVISATTSTAPSSALSSGGDDPFTHSEDFSHSLDGPHHHSTPPALPGTPPEQTRIARDKSESPRIMARMASGDSEVSRLDARKSDSQIQHRRSRSRLRGLKFWKRRRDFSGVESGSTVSSSP